jgi:hypothetical protein
MGNRKTMVRWVRLWPKAACGGRQAIVSGGWQWMGMWGVQVRRGEVWRVLNMHGKRKK